MSLRGRVALVTGARVGLPWPHLSEREPAGLLEKSGTRHRNGWRHYQYGSAGIDGRDRHELTS